MEEEEGAVKSNSACNLRKSIQSSTGEHDENQ